jgi:hypothetical protein
MNIIGRENNFNRTSGRIRPEPTEVQVMNLLGHIDRGGERCGDNFARVTHLTANYKGVLASPVSSESG